MRWLFCNNRRACVILNRWILEQLALQADRLWSYDRKLTRLLANNMGAEAWLSSTVFHFKVCRIRAFSINSSKTTLPAKRSLILSKMLYHIIKLKPLPKLITTVDNASLWYTVFSLRFLTFKFLLLWDPNLVVFVKKQKLSHVIIWLVLAISSRRILDDCTIIKSLVVRDVVLDLFYKCSQRFTI